MADPIKRPRYFNSQFLRADEFNGEQNYHLDMRRRHNRLLHSAGVAEGLGVAQADGANQVNVQPGTAYDAQGREIVLVEAEKVEIADATAAAVYVTIAYEEKPTDPKSEGGTSDNTRWTEKPKLGASKDFPTDPTMTLVLAKVSLNGGVITSVDETGRLIAGAKGSELKIRSVTLTNSGDKTTWPAFSSPAPNTAALGNGALRLDANREIVFQEGGGISSGNSTHRLFFNKPNSSLDLQDSGGIRFLTGPDQQTERMKISSDGRVVIGPTISTALLSIDRGSTSAFALSLAGSGIGSAITFFNKTASTNLYGIYSGNDAKWHFADFTTNQDRLTVDKSGNVGIGTQTPGSLLDVRGQLRVSQPLVFTDSNTGTPYTDNSIGMGNTIEGSNKWLQLTGIREADNLRRLALVAEKVHVSGSLLVGTNSSFARAEIRTSASSTVGLMLTSTAGDSGWGSGLIHRYMTGPDVFKTYGMYVGNDKKWHFADTDLGTDRLTIDQSGKVGVGTQVPEARLEVETGSTNNIALQLISTGGADWGSGVVFMNRNASSSTPIESAKVTSSSAVSSATIIADVPPPNTVNGEYGIYAGSDGKWHFRDRTTNLDRLTIDATGKVGIGTSTPNYFLDVNGRMRIRHTSSSDTAGVWLSGTTTTQTEKAFIGLKNDKSVGFWSEDPGKKGWGFTMDLTTWKIESPMWKAFRSADNLGNPMPGPLPKTITFASGGGLLLIFVAGSGYRHQSSTPGEIGMAVKVDGVVKGNAKVITNEVGSHRSFVPLMLVEAVAAGNNHTITLEAQLSTTTDQFDYFNVTIIEMPI